MIMCHSTSWHILAEINTKIKMQHNRKPRNTSHINIVKWHFTKLSIQFTLEGKVLVKNNAESIIYVYGKINIVNCFKTDNRFSTNLKKANLPEKHRCTSLW